MTVLSDRFPFHMRLVSELTQLDQRQERSERKRRLGVNIYRLGHYLKAAQDVQEYIDSGISPEAAFVDVFSPSAGMHTVARHLGLKLDVERGQWIPLQETRS